MVRLGDSAWQRGKSRLEVCHGRINFMTAAIVEELALHPELAYRHTLDSYHAMIANGTILEGEPFELLDGQIVHKIRSASGEDLMTVGVEHALIVMRLAKLSSAFEARGCHLRSQQPITLPPHDEPEPDAVIVRGTLEDYSDHHPSSCSSSKSPRLSSLFPRLESPSCVILVCRSWPACW